MSEELLIFILAVIVLGVPVMGLTARFAMKPLIESILRVREAFLTESRTGGASATELARLEQEVSELREQVQRLTEAAEFDRKLLGSDDRG